MCTLLFWLFCQNFLNKKEENIEELIEIVSEDESIYNINDFETYSNMENNDKNEILEVSSSIMDVDMIIEKSDATLKIEKNLHIFI